MLTVEYLTKRFGEMLAVDNVSFHLSPGETVALLGPSGCGKTTTLRMIAGFTRPNNGIIYIKGKDMTPLRPYERNVGILFQDYALFPHMTVRENIAFGPLHRGLSRAAATECVDRYLGMVGMTSMANRYPSTLSGGQQQRVALSRALATEPEIVLLDEPLSSLDAKLRERLRIELKQILSDANATTIVVTHDQEEALSLADRVLVMHQGRILQDAPPHTIYYRPVNRFVAEFVGRSNWMRGHVVDCDGSALFRSVDGISFPAPAHLPSDREILCFLRPERITLSAKGQNNQDPEHLHLDGWIRSKIFLGQDTEVIVNVDAKEDITILDRGKETSTINIGDPVTLSFAPTDVGFVEDE